MSSPRKDPATSMRWDDADGTKGYRCIQQHLNIASFCARVTGNITPLTVSSGEACSIVRTWKERKSCCLLHSGVLRNAKGDFGLEAMPRKKPRL